MKLYLSSMGLGASPERLAALGGANRSVAVVQNAQDDGADERRRRDRLAGEFSELRSIGLEPEEIDLRRFFGRESELERRIEDFGYIWVTGGNTFVLRRAFASSGLDRILEARRSRDDLVYGGYSAGACVLGPTLRGIEFADDPTVVPDGYDDAPIWDGLDFVPYCIVPHFWGYEESALDRRTIDYLVENKLPFVALRDSEVLVTRAAEHPSEERISEK